MAKVGIIGHVDHGKHALTAAIIAVHKNFPTAEELTMTTETNTPGAGLPDPDRAAVVRALVRAYCYTQEFAERYFDSHFVARELPAASSGEKRWPFVESPGEFTERLRVAMQNFPLIGAVRNVLIENPPTLAPAPSTTGSGESLESQVDRLATFILQNIPGEPSQDQGAIDTAIRLLTPSDQFGAGEGEVGDHLRRLVGKLAQWQLCMSYNDSYFGEPAGLVKQVVAEMVKAVDPIYPPMPVPVDPLAGVTIYTGTSALAAKAEGDGGGVVVRFDSCDFSGDPPCGFATWAGWFKQVARTGVVAGVRIANNPTTQATQP